MKPTVNIIWFRRDLRLQDNAALYHALKSSLPVVPIFIFDTNILDRLEDKADRRVEFIHIALADMQQQLVNLGSSFEVYYATPLEAFQVLLAKYSIEKVFTNHDYEQYAIDRDAQISHLLQEHGASLHTYKDTVIFDKEEVVKDDGKPYTVFTPYSRKWKTALQPFHLKAYPTENYFGNFYKQAAQPLPSLESMGFLAVGKPFPGKELNTQMTTKYQEQRNFPAVNGTSHLGIHLRFGTISIRALANQGKGLSETFLNELIWRDFYHAILWHFPHVRAGHAFKKEYEAIEWVNNEAHFYKWCEGKTGYPIVDAGMRELNATGYMHNRVRMVVASFLTKHLLTDWRWGEQYFAQKLLDFDFAANNGGWQWAAGCGCDAAPYFRVFNPTLQTEKFDKSLQYIRKWVPELDSFDYPQPIVPHEFARKRALEVYGKALKGGTAG
ncbi:cryptochrome/photolyase family protein [Parasediminibacterium sp. JCM 36343]|uniref:cryptochrome/photolyase family protein n=1 Tax=Parasediminibacterium sp. JCM 36343 TaxID=3374279 RepID=UPI00397B108D